MSRHACEPRPIWSQLITTLARLNEFKIHEIDFKMKHDKSFIAAVKDTVEHGCSDGPGSSLFAGTLSIETRLAKRRMRLASFVLDGCFVVEEPINATEPQAFIDVVPSRVRDTAIKLALNEAWQEVINNAAAKYAIEVDEYRLSTILFNVEDEKVTMLEFNAFRAGHETSALISDLVLDGAVSPQLLATLFKKHAAAYPEDNDNEMQIHA